jgi:cytochrome c oxidase subunit II
MRVRRGSLRLGLLALLAGALAGCIPAPATRQGDAIASLYDVAMVLAAGVAITVYGLATFAVLRYRRKRGDETLPGQVQGNARIEALWTAIPLLIVGGLFAGTLVVLGQTDAQASQPAVEIHVTAFRWGWTFDYLNEGIEVSGMGLPGPQAVVPVGQPLRFELSSQDVIHSLFVPQFLFKRDAIPGRTTTFDITIQQAGTYGGQCAEFCGIGHSQMAFTIRAVSPADYQAWVAQEQASGGAPAASAGATP